MDYWHLLLDLPAIIGASSMLALLSPWKMQPRAVPALLFVVGLIVMMLPTLPVVALAMMLPAALIQRLLGIELHGHEAADYGPAVAKAKSAVQTIVAGNLAALERVRRLQPVAVTQFVDRAYPSPEDAAELAHADADVEDDDPGDLDDATGDTGSTEPEQSPAEQMKTRLDDLLRDPALPAGARSRLAGQRSGRDTSVGLRNQHAPVRSFVPAL